MIHLARNEMIQFFKQISEKLGSNIYAGFKGQTTPQSIAFIRQLQKELRESNCLDTPLHEVKVVVFDMETTGFFPEKGDQMISIGAVKMIGHRIQEEQTFYSLVKSDRPLSDELTSLTNINQEQLQSAPEAAEVLLQFFKFASGHILVAHHSKHEQSFMQKMTWDLLRTRFEHRVIDTSFLIRLVTPSQSSLPLDTVCQGCNIEIKNRHHALGDAILTAYVWGHYLQIAMNMGFANLREIYEYIAKL